mgnify:CR=1 FL=1
MSSDRIGLDQALVQHKVDEAELAAVPFLARYSGRSTSPTPPAVFPRDGLSMLVQLAGSGGGSPGPVSGWLGEALGHRAGSGGRCSAAVAGAGVHDEIPVGRWRRRDSELEKPKEHETPGAAGATVEPKRVLVQILLKMAGADRSLVGAQDPPFRQ